MPLRKENEPTAKKVPTTKIDDTQGDVSYRLSITKNLGNYESLKIEVGVTLPITTDENTLKRVDELLVIAKSKVVPIIEQEVSDVSSHLKTT